MKKIKLQFLISYFGTLPFIIIFFDLILFNFFPIFILKDFVILYILIIFSFIGAMRWSFYENTNSIKILYGFLPSFISTILIAMNLLNFNKNFISILIIIFLNIQLVCDFYHINNKIEKIFFFKVRLPLVIIMSLILFYLISV